MKVTYTKLKQLLQDMHYGDQVQKEVDMYKEHKMTGMSLPQVQFKCKQIKKGKLAEKELINLGYLDKKGSFINSENPVFRSIRKWYENNFC